MKPLFHPYQTHPHPDHLGSIVQRFSLGIKEHDNNTQTLSSKEQETGQTLCPT